MSTNNKFFFTVAAFLTLVFCGLILIGDQTVPKVKDVSVSNTQVKLTFNRLIDAKKLESNFEISPNLPGDFSWIGRKMAFTAKFEPGTTYTIKIPSLTDINSKSSPDIFEYTFTTESRKLLFLKDRSIYKFDFLDKSETKLTPSNLKVLEYKHAQNSVYFFAVDQDFFDPESYLSDAQELFKMDLVTGKIKKIAKAGKFVNFWFTVSSDGNATALIRAELNNKILQNRHIAIITDQKTEQFWLDRLVEYPIWFSPFGDSLLGPAYDVGYIIAPLEFNPNKVQELGSFTYSFGFSPNAQNILFSKQDSLIALNSDGTKTTFKMNGELDTVQIFNDNFYLTAETTTGYQLLKYNFDSQSETLLMQDSSKSLEVFSISQDQQIIAIEKFPLISEIGLGSKARAYKENIENSFQNTDIFIYDLRGAEIKKIIEIKGRFPKLIN